MTTHADRMNIILNAEVRALRKALCEASIALAAIGQPEPLTAPDAYLCGVIARSALTRVDDALRTEHNKPS